MIVDENITPDKRKLEPPFRPVVKPTLTSAPAATPAAAPAATPAPVEMGGTVLTSSAGDGFGAGPAVPATPVIASPAKGVPTELGGTTITSTAGDGFAAAPATALPPVAADGKPAATQMGFGGQVITSSAGDGFGAPPAALPPAAAPQTALPPAPVQSAGPPLVSRAGDGFGAPAAPAAAAPATSAGVDPRLAPTNPNDALTTRTIQPGNALDRLKVAQEQYDTFVKSTDPAYQAALRDATRRGAAAGGLGSGELRTTYGDLAANRGTQLDTKRDTVFQDALLGGVEDARFATGVAQQQQGFQNQQQQQAFMNELSRLGFDDSMLNSAFGRALQTWMAGQTGGTGSASAAAYGANVAGQGNDALAALANLIRSNAAATAPVGAPAPTALPPNADAAKIFPWM